MDLGHELFVNNVYWLLCLTRLVAPVLCYVWVRLTPFTSSRFPIQRHFRTLHCCFRISKARRQRDCWSIMALHCILP